jgi:hypothetical protein
MAKIIKLSSYKTLIKNPKLSELYDKYDDITEAQCYSLIITLYDNDKIFWVNPLDWNFIHKASDISISFLSKCYYVWGDKIVGIDSFKLSYKEHIKKFIDKEYLFDVRKLSKSPPKVSSNSPPGAATNKPKSPPKVSSNSPPGAATNKPKSPSKVSSNSPPGAATNKPKSPPKVSSVSPPGASSSKKHIKFKSISVKNINKNADKLTEDSCLKFVEYIKEKIGSAKTPAELQKLTFINPITSKKIGIDSPILQSFLTKCYYSFNNKEIKNIIEELINVSDLMHDDSLKKPATAKPATAKPVTPTKSNEIAVIEEGINNAIKDFYKCCDELIANCHANGILKKHHYITNVVNSIMTIIHIKYAHLQNLYNGVDIKDNMPLQIYMNDEIFNNHLLGLGVDPKKTFIDNYNSKNIIYQQNDLQVSNIKSELYPKHIDTYYMSNLYNRQYVFEYANPSFYKKTTEFSLYYNMVNIKFLALKPYPESLELAKDVFNSKKKPEFPFNYNITNSVLPKYIFSNYNNEVSKYFTDIIDLVNVKLQTLPIIKGFSNEHTDFTLFNYFNSVINNMNESSYGNNETDYGDYDMIRKNILYSLNAQTQSYKRKKILYDKIYYNSKFTGTFPLFTWIPLNHHKKTSIYNYANSEKWQPLGITQFEQREIERFYKNNGKGSYSADLNNTIYKVITNEYASINSLKDSQRPQFNFLVDEMRERVTNTIGLYKSKTRKTLQEYSNNKIYLYHGAKNRLHNIGGKWNEDIEILGFLSTTLNMYTASFYSGIAVNNVGIIYIIEVDDTHGYINLNDPLMQYLLLPYSRIRVVYEFNFDKLCVVLCRLFRTPSIETNNKLYNKLLDINKPTSADNNKYVSYRIKANNNETPECAFMLSKFWKTNKESGKEDLEVYKIKRDNLNNKRINNLSLSPTKLKETFIYFSLGQEYQLYIERALPLILGSFEDIKYSIHQHFIMECYKPLGIPCIDYIFIHSPFINNAISTGILLHDYKNNTSDQYKYNVNNFLIDCIFKFDCIKSENRELIILDEFRDGLYSDKIEGFRDAGLYCNGVINPLFNKFADVGEHIQYIRNWKHLFTKYKHASDDDLKKHFKWCNNRIEQLIEIIKATKDKYLIFINETLNGNMKDTNFDKKGNLDRASKESLELNKMINNLLIILIKRASVYKKYTSAQEVQSFIDIIRVVLSDDHINLHNSKLYQNPVLDDLILHDDKSGSLTGGILSIKDIKKLNTQIKQDSSKIIDHQKLYESFKNIPIQESKDMRKYADMPKLLRKYYKGANVDKDGYININDKCYSRFV